jgi:20S proteasome alpha/beta subunit
MTMCLGVNLGHAVVLAADGRRTMSSGDRVDDVQKLVKITDTLWSAGAGTLSMSAYLQAVLAER